MALFNDSGLIGIADLKAYEANLSNIASTHGINIDTKTAMTLDYVGGRLLQRLVRAGAADSQSTGSWLTGASAIYSMPPQQSWLFTLSNVVVTPPLRRWICFEVLSQVFAEAYNTQLNDRFKGKWTEYTARSSDAEYSVSQLGIGVVRNPLARPAEALVTVAAGSISAGIIIVQAAWVDAQGNEGALSPLAPVTLSDSSSITVEMPGDLNQAPTSAIGWNVYVGWGGSEPSRQNLAPLAKGEPWSVPETGFVSGAAPIDGQTPEFYIVDPQRLRRG
jgi:hypothetical protein